MKQVEMIKQLSAYEYRLAGYLPVHDWMKRFGIKPHNVPIATISGFVAYLLGNIPKKRRCRQLEESDLHGRTSQKAQNSNGIIILKNSESNGCLVYCS